MANDYHAAYRYLLFAQGPQSNAYSCSSVCLKQKFEMEAHQKHSEVKSCPGPRLRAPD